jgi:hypothetical protein
MRKKFLIIAGLMMLSFLIMCSSVMAKTTEEKYKETESDTTNILFIGNSKTYYNSFPVIFYKLTQATQIDNVNIECVLQGGKTLEWLYKNKIADNDSILNNTWDYVVLQDHTDNGLSNYSKMKNGASAIVNALKENNPEIKVVYNAVWALNTSTEEEQMTTTKNYEKVAKVTGGVISYSGNAFLNAQNAYPEITLYNSDNKHPTVEGSYLSACCLYKTIYNKSTEGIKYYGEITDEDLGKYISTSIWNKTNESLSESVATELQKIADNVTNVSIVQEPKIKLVKTNKDKLEIRVYADNGVDKSSLKLYKVENNKKKEIDFTISSYEKLENGKYNYKITVKSSLLTSNKKTKFYIEAKDSSKKCYLHEYFIIKKLSKKNSDGEYYSSDVAPQITASFTDTGHITFSCSDGSGIDNVCITTLYNNSENTVIKKYSGASTNSWSKITSTKKINSKTYVKNAVTTTFNLSKLDKLSNYKGKNPVISKGVYKIRIYARDYSGNTVAKSIILNSNLSLDT